MPFCRTSRALARTVRRPSGFTLVEFLIAGTLSVVVLGALVSFSLGSSHNLLMTRNYLVLEAQARTALDKLTLEIRQALAVTNATATSLTVVDPDGNLLTYAYDASRKQLTRTYANDTTVLLNDCDRLVFSLYNGDPQSDTFELVATDRAADCKAVRVEWDCSKSFIEKRVNAVNSTSATIVMRMK